MGKNAIELSNVTQRFSEKTVLSGIDLSVPEGKIFGLLGPSGAGKTTLIRILTGQLAPTDGKVLTLGKDAGTLRGEDYRKIGIMMDDFGVYERMSCLENLRFFTKIYGIPKKCAEEALERVGLSEAKKTKALELSKGMRSRLRLARVLMLGAAVLFLDEPTSGLDPATADDIRSVILTEKERGATIFLTTHNMAEAAKMCDDIALLCDGSIIERGAPDEICRRYNHRRRLSIRLTDGTEMELPHDSTAAQETARLLENGTLETIHSTEPDLETVFMELTGRRYELK